MNARPLPFLTIDELDRFWSCVEKTETCWNWRGVRVAIAKGSRHEYGVLNLRRDSRRTNFKAHRISKALVSGDRPSLDIDHGCGNKLCVNPDHLEWVTHAENIKRAKAKRTHCGRGHEFAVVGRNANGWGCRACMNLKHRERRARLRAASPGIGTPKVDQPETPRYSDQERSVSYGR